MATILQYPVYQQTQYVWLLVDRFCLTLIQIVRVNMMSGLSSGFVYQGLPDLLSGPTFLTFHPTTGDLFVSSKENNQVLQYSSAGQLKAAIVSYSILRSPSGISYSHVSGNFYIASSTTNVVMRSLVLIMRSATRTWACARHIYRSRLMS